MQASFALMGGAAVLLAIGAHLADRRRLRRSDPDRVGFMPWPTVALLATAAAVLLFALALTS